MDKLKYIRIQQGDDQYYGDIPIGVDAENVDFKNGNNLQDILGDYNYASFGDINTKFDSIETQVEREINDIEAEVVKEIQDRQNGDTAKDKQIAILSERMDTFSKLPDGYLDNSAEAELADIRVKADGTSATRAGNAVREQILELENDISNCYAKNLIGTNYASGDSRLTNGIQYFVSSDGSILVNGTATKDAYFNIFSTDSEHSIPAGYYTISVAKNDSNIRVNAVAIDADTKTTKVNFSVSSSMAITRTKYIPDNCYFRLNVYVPAGKTVNNGKVSLMFEAGQVGHEYMSPFVTNESISQIAYKDFTIVDTYSDLAKTTTKRVLVLKNDSAFGDNGPCWFSVREGQFRDGDNRNDGSVVYPIAGQSPRMNTLVPEEELLDVIKTYIGKSELVYDQGNTLFEANTVNNIDCSAFVWAVLFGIKYENSRYVLGPDKKNIFSEFPVDGLVKYNSDINDFMRLNSRNSARYFAEQKCLYEFPTGEECARKAANMLRVGDILFSASYSQQSYTQRYYAIDHIMIVIGVYPNSPYVLVAAGGGLPQAYVKNEDTVCKTGVIHFTQENVGTRFRVFARPSYNLDRLQNIRLRKSIAEAAKGINLLPIKLSLNSIINSNTGRYEPFTTYCASYEFYEISPGSTLRYTGEKENENNKAYRLFIAQYNKEKVFISRNEVSMDTGEITLSNNTYYIRVCFGFASSLKESIHFSDIDNFEMIVTQ